MRGWFVIPVTGRWVEHFSRVSRVLFSHVKHEVTYCETATHSMLYIHKFIKSCASIHRNRYTMRIQQRKLNIQNSVLFTLHICMNWQGTHCKKSKMSKWIYLWIYRNIAASVYIFAFPHQLIANWSDLPSSYIIDFSFCWDTYMRNFAFWGFKLNIKVN